MNRIDIVNKVNNENGQLIDVRSPEQFQADHIDIAKNIPFALLSSRLNEFDKSQRYYIICQKGIRSKQACELLKEHGIEAMSVEGGMEKFLEN